MSPNQGPAKMVVPLLAFLYTLNQGEFKGYPSTKTILELRLVKNAQKPCSFLLKPWLVRFSSIQCDQSPPCRRSRDAKRRHRAAAAAARTRPAAASAWCPVLRGEQEVPHRIGDQKGSTAGHVRKARGTDQQKSRGLVWARFLEVPFWKTALNLVPFGGLRETKEKRKEPSFSNPKVTHGLVSKHPIFVGGKH